MTDIRVFVSIAIPDPAPLEEVLDAIGCVRNVKASPPEQIHITLRFIGDVDESRIGDVEDCVRRACDGTGPFTVRVAGAGYFSRQGRPSVVWIGASPQKGMAALSDRIARNLDAADIDYDRKPFKSHITIGRCRGPADLSGIVSEYSGREFLTFECAEVLVMRSVLGPAGAKHTVLRRIPLQK